MIYLTGQQMQSSKIFVWRSVTRTCDNLWGQWLSLRTTTLLMRQTTTYLMIVIVYKNRPDCVNCAVIWKSWKMSWSRYSRSRSQNQMSRSQRNPEKSRSRLGLKARRLGRDLHSLVYIPASTIHTTKRTSYTNANISKAWLKTLADKHLTY